ncbi:Mu transposase C-terminal domain-containing protein [Andreprevotia chitinilytica]|uniref:Mu transposase C-terminal domain-containing protein n=1 Tax=Andreprevotia chitinilytica TaxID=396808 RepID=UPI0009FFA5B3|nr:Mu transposase C-terminal domain-containing protein [Andreprevotia chitinilytica]
MNVTLIEISTALGITKRSVERRAKNWPFTEEVVRGGKKRLYPLGTLPEDVRKAVQLHTARQLLNTLPAPVESIQPAAPARQALAPARPPVVMTDALRRRTDARHAVLRAITRLQAVCSLSKENAVAALIVEANKAPESEMAQLLVLAQDERGRKGSGMPSIRTIKRWFTKAQAGDLTPRPPRVKDLSLPRWGAAFLQCWRAKQGQSVEAAYKTFTQQWHGGELPSVHQVRRFLAKLPPEMRYRLEHTGAALKAKLPYVIRDWSVFKTGECWVGDGHGMKMKVAKPDDGKPCQPEVTVIMDATSRKVVGWSVSYSENVLAVADALRHAATHHPLPLLYYSDNGSGQANLMLDAPIVGMLARMGIDHQTGIPGNPQGRGLIERFWKTVTLPLARQFDTFHGNGVDQDSLRMTTRDIQKALTRAKRSTGPSSVPKLPSWQQFIDALTVAIDEYNAQHAHSALPTRQGRHLTPNAFWQLHPPTQSRHLSAAELQALFRPHVVRTAERGMVRLWNNHYFNRDLMQVDGEQVQVGYDIHDANTVVVRHMNGEFVCVAEWNANKVDAFPKPFVERLRDQRIQGIVGRAEETIRRAEAERPALEAQEHIVIPGMGDLTRSSLNRKAAELLIEPVDEPAVTGAAPTWESMDGPARYRAWRELDTRKRQGKPLTEAEDTRHRMYQKSPQWQVMHSLHSGNDNAHELHLVRAG